MADTSLREFLVRTASGSHFIKARSPFKAAVAVVKKYRPNLGAIMEVVDLAQGIGYVASEKVVTAAKAWSKVRSATGRSE